MTSIDVAAPPQDVQARTRAAVAPLVRAALDELPGETREVVEHALASQDFSTAALVQLSAAAFGDDDVALIAVALEFADVHEKLHADLMHRTGAREVFGADRTVSAADALLSLACARLTKPGVMLLNVALMSVVDGYVQEIGMDEDASADMAQHLGVAAAKHSSLPAAACELGALAAGATASQAAHLRQFGDDLGLARKHVDDIRGIHDDLASGRRTLPVVVAINAGVEVDGPDSHAAVVAAGGLRWCEQQAELLLARGLNHLRQCTPQAVAAGELAGLARRVTTDRLVAVVPSQPTAPAEPAASSQPTAPA
ncbi:polyprenyl synthetase family protein [Lentzea sp. NPDC058450]|uniref:polyprenyl synthetase family protein n=1 Tax=Lentzea sp. NPDC058450 TaxID=3346505 RepID=UPI00366A1ACE